jgi:hypothetical protein
VAGYALSCVNNAIKLIRGNLPTAAMKEIQIVIPDQALKDVNDILKESQVGGMSHYRIHCFIIIVYETSE